MPQLIYGKWMQRIGTFLLPVFVITNFPGLFLMGELSAPMAVWGVACTDRILFDRTGGVESGSEGLYVGEHVRSF